MSRKGRGAVSRKEELVEQLRGLAGSPSELAEAVGVEPTDASFRRAVKDLEEEGVLVAEGSSRDRRYRNTAVVDALAELVGLLPCLARDFSEAGKRLGFSPEEIAAVRERLQIETHKDQGTGRWWCRQVEGYVPPTLIASGFGAAVELGIDRGVARTEAFARMSARAGRGGHIIGSGVPMKK